MLQMNRLLIPLLMIMNTIDDARAGDDALNDLESLRWMKRVILVYAPEPLLKNALVNLDEHAAGIEERDIAWFALDAGSLHSNYAGAIGETLREHILTWYFTPPPADTAVLLIGKDGGVKSRTSDLDLEATFGLIDQMPMRRLEMRRVRDDTD